MILRSIVVFLAIMLGCQWQVLAGDFVVPARTTAPFTYCVWYLPDPDKAEFLTDLAQAPPDLFHLGYHIPFKGALGPTYGHELYTDDILPPDQIPREIARIQRVLKMMRDAGVSRLIPYVFTMALFGQAEQRSGFFHFYDHWEDYATFGLGSKPAADPSLWTQVSGPQQLSGAPPGFLHYEPCINHPAWARYLDLVLQQAAKVGYDGMFFDVNTLYCYCPHCQERFDIYLLAKYGRQGLRDCFGSDDHRLINLSTIYRDFEAAVLSGFKPYLAQQWARDDLGGVLGVTEIGEVKLPGDWRLLRCYMQQSQAEFPPGADFNAFLSTQFGGDRAAEIATGSRDEFVQTVVRHYFLRFLASDELAHLLTSRFNSADIRRRCCSSPVEMLLWVETQRFWCESMARQFARLKRVGQTTLRQEGRKEAFYTVANLGSMATMDALNKRRVSAIDLVRWAPAADMQMFEEMSQPGCLESGVIISNIFAFRWAMAAGTRAGTLLYQATSERAADLSEAEVAAGGGGAFIQAGLSAPESRRRWKRFFATHADLWDQGRSWAKVALLYWNDQVFYEYPEHNAIAHRLVHVLSESQVPFDMVTEQGLDSIGAYPVLLAPMLRYLDEAQIETILNYARNGGNLVIVEPFATEDRRARLQAANPSTARNIQTGVYGAGKILRLRADEVPARQSDLWCLMEERANAYVLAREYLNRTRGADRAAGVDLGPRFVRRLEETFQLRLRWCSEQADPAIYIHAYELPAAQSRPQRIVVHAVNYHLPILVEKDRGAAGNMTCSSVSQSDGPVVGKDLQISVPLPTGWRAEHVQAFSPTDQVAPIQWRGEGQQVTLNIKEIEIYQAIGIDLERE